VLRAILKSEVLKEAISELSDLPGAGSVRVSVAPHEPHFHLAAGGVYGALEIFLPKSSEVRLILGQNRGLLPFPFTILFLH
jgi:hypothetical protein